ncbi:MAG: DUF2071 domain-containing protein [Flavobacteriaceae bacterium]|nr:DUF2071 domain-containing protein [Flavobacteriaceae bacterium]
MSFLKAEWRKLALLNYEISPALLKDYVPHGTELDHWQDRCYVSMVGFMFENVRLLGVKVPYHVNFEEVNLRFYVRRKVNNEWRRGVVFIKEIVPKPAITFIANTVYKENYETLPMKHSWETNNDKFTAEYNWKIASGWQSIKVLAENRLVPIEVGSEAEFITEHYWGYAKVSEEKTNEYEVTHPRWKQYPVIGFSSEIDFEANYGAKFAFLNEATPTSVQLAEGSEITVEGKQRLG